MTYQKQVNETAARIEEAKEKARQKKNKITEKKLKMAESKLNGETGVTTSHNEIEEPLLNNSEIPELAAAAGGIKTTVETAVNAEGDSDDGEDIDEIDDLDNFVMRNLKKKNSNVQYRRDTTKTVNADSDEDDDNKSNSSFDSFCTDSSGDSILDESYDDLDPDDKALQTQIMTNFVRRYKDGFKSGKSFLIRQETKFSTFSPTNKDSGEFG